VNPRPYTPPTKILGPVGWGLPPAGSSVTAKALACVPRGTLTNISEPAPVAGASMPALIGFPSAGTSQSW